MSLFLYMVLQECSNFILLHVAVHFPTTPCCRDCLFSIVCSCLLCHRLTELKCVGSFLGSLSSCICLTFWRTANLFCTVALLFTIPPAVCKGFGFILSWRYKNLLLSIFLIIVFLMGMSSGISLFNNILWRFSFNLFDFRLYLLASWYGRWGFSCLPPPPWSTLTLPFPHPSCSPVSSQRARSDSLLWLSIVCVEPYGIMITFCFFWFLSC